MRYASLVRASNIGVLVSFLTNTALTLVNNADIMSIVNVMQEGVGMQTVAAVNDAGTRERLSGPAIRGFLKLSETWGLTADERIELLGASLSRGTLANWASGRTGTLSADQLMRISLLLGIYEGLQRVWRRAPAEADAWIRRHRLEEPFRGEAPLEFMRQRGIPALMLARAYVDGLTGGPPSRADYVQPPREGL